MNYLCNNFLYFFVFFSFSKLYVSYFVKYVIVLGFCFWFGCKED